MLKFSELEFALNKIAGYSFNDGPFVGTEGKVLKIILGKRNPKKLQSELSAFLIKTTDKFNSKLKAMRPTLTIKEYHQKTGMTEKQIRYLISKGKITALPISENRRKIWLIPVTGVNIK